MDEKEDYFIEKLGLNNIKTLTENVSINSNEYYSLQYYILNTYYWSNLSNELIWKIFLGLKQNKPKYSEILDYGCGVGLFTNKLKEICSSYTGVDISETAINVAKYVWDKNDIRFLRLVDHEKDLHSKYDLIFCSETLDHIKNPESVFGTFSKVLNANGQIYITTTTLYHYIFRIIFIFFYPDIIENKNPIKFLKRIYIYIMSLFLYGYRSRLLSDALERSDHVNAFSLRELKSLAKKSNLRIVDYSYFNCKDLIPNSRFGWLNSFVKEKLQKSKIYGQNICILLEKNTTDQIKKKS